MKFGKQLELGTNEAWREHYVQYKRLKRIIKRVVFQRARFDSLMSSNSNDESSPILARQASKNDMEAARDEFWSLLEENIRTINHFFTGRIISLSNDIHKFETYYADEEIGGHVHAQRKSQSESKIKYKYMYIYMHLNNWFYFYVGTERGFARLQEMYDEIVDLRTLYVLGMEYLRVIVIIHVFC